MQDALTEPGLFDTYRSRPAYQQNDYIGWISRAKRQATKSNRLAHTEGTGVLEDIVPGRRETGRVPIHFLVMLAPQW